MSCAIVKAAGGFRQAVKQEDGQHWGAVLKYRVTSIKSRIVCPLPVGPMAHRASFLWKWQRGQGSGRYRITAILPHLPAQEAMLKQVVSSQTLLAAAKIVSKNLELSIHKRVGLPCEVVVATQNLLERR
jgi:hypothetical protein